MSDLQYIEISDADREKAKAFFTRATPLINAAQYDYAIEMMINGLRLDPENVDAHQTLRDASLRRKASGGKSMGMMDRMKLSTKGKDSRVNLLNAEKLLAFDPGNMDHMQSLMEAAFREGCFDTVLWIAAILKRANIEAAKPEFGKFEKVRDHYASLKRWADAVEVCSRMVQMKPDDMDLKNELKNLSAQEAMFKGQYTKSYRSSIRDKDKQAALLEEERDIVGTDYLTKVAQEAEAELAKNPDDQARIAKLVEALRKMNTAEAERKAEQVLTDAYQRTRAFRFRLQLIDMRLRHNVNQERALRADAAGEKDEAAKAEKVEAYRAFVAGRAEEELALFTEVSEQYPSEAKYKFEMAKRLVALKRYTDAIPLFQLSVGDPKLRTAATLELGKTFLAAEFPDEAADTLRGLSETYPTLAAGDETAKQIMYWLGRSYEEIKNYAEALRAYSQVVKWEFNYLDTQQRIKSIRGKMQS